MTFLPYLLVTAGVTYLVRMIPMVLLKKKIRSRYLLSFLHYIPYAVLSVMTVPAIFSAAESPLSAASGFVVAVILITGIGGLSLTFGKVTLTSIACALILGIITNLLLQKGKED